MRTQRKIVLTGSEVLLRRNFSDLAGMRIGFIGNHTSRLADGTPTHVALHRAENVDLAALLSPEHGAFGREDREDIGDETDPATGLPIYSLYGAARKPTPDMLSGLDALVFEVQDIGARFYTYASTMLLAMEAAQEAGIGFIVLDRPNPITGGIVEGPIADGDKLSFVASHRIPVRHGLTLGELARVAGAERSLDSKLRVIACAHLSRAQWWDQTGLEWVNPSPAMRSLEAATLYPGVCLLEQANVSMGRGTETPFSLVGAPWIDSVRWADTINSHAGAGVIATSTEFTPSLRKFEGEVCQGVRLTITNRDLLRSVRLGIAMIVALRDAHGDLFEMENIIKLIANQSVMDAIKSGGSVDEIVHLWQEPLDAWRKAVEKHLLYPPISIET